MSYETLSGTASTHTLETIPGGSAEAQITPAPPDWLPKFSHNNHWTVNDALDEQAKLWMPERSHVREYWQNVAFFSNAFIEAQQIEWTSRSINGPQHEMLNGVLSRSSRLLARLHPTLTPGVMVPTMYREEADKTILYEAEKERPGTVLDVEQLRQAKVKAINRLTEQDDRLQKHTLRKGLLDEPIYQPQFNSQGCTGAVFSMVLSGITGKEIVSAALEKAVRNIYRQSIVHDEEYLKLLQTPSVRNRFRVTPQAFSFTGGDLDFVSTTVAKLRSRLPEAKVYCVINILSDTNTETRMNGIWHSNVLLGAYEDSVYVHDPAIINGARKRLDKTDFYKRWMQACGRGHIIIDT